MSGQPAGGWTKEICERCTLTYPLPTFMNRNLLPRIVASAVLLFALASCRNRQDDQPPKPKVSGVAPVPAAALPKLGAAPKWALKDLDGNTVSGEQLRGKVVVLDFWATWCGPCLMEIPGYVQMQQKYGKEGLVIVGASVDQGGAEVVKAFAGKKGINYTMVMADEAVVTAFGGIEAIPTTFLIDRNGQIRDRKLGAEESADYEKKVAAVMAEKA